MPDENEIQKDETKVSGIGEDDFYDELVQFGDSITGGQQKESDSNTVVVRHGRGKHAYRVIHHVKRGFHSIANRPSVKRGYAHAQTIAKNASQNTSTAVKKVVSHELEQRERQHRYPYANPKASSTRAKYHLPPGPGAHGNMNRYQDTTDRDSFFNRLTGTASNTTVDLLGESSANNKKKIRLI